MKIFSLVVILIFIHCCSAANRTTMWYIANNQVYTASATPLYQFCNGLNPGITTGTTNFALFSSSKLTVTGTINSAIASAQTGTPAANVAVTNTALLTALTLVFTYNSSYSLTLSLASGTTLSASNILATGAGASGTNSNANQLLVSTPSSFPITIDGNRVYSPTGSVWLYIINLQELNTGATFASGTNSVIGGSVVIVDYVSYSTIAITKFKDGTILNTLYSIGIRTLTSSVTSATLLSSGTGCTTSAGRKRSVEHLVRNKRAISCSGMTSLDPSLSTTTIASICSNAALSTIYNSVAGSTTTDTLLTDSATRAINAINSLYVADTAAFSAAGTKFPIFANFGILIAFSTIIFSYLN